MSLTVSGTLDGQQLWNRLSDNAKKMKESWCRRTGDRNTARPQQLVQMLNTYLNETFPRPDKPNQSLISWSGAIEGEITLKISTKIEGAQNMLDRARHILKYKPE